METNVYHTPALLTETIEGLNIKPDGTYADVTFGGGGHSRAILKAMEADGVLLGLDRDIDAMANSPEDERFIFVRSDYRYLGNFARYHGIDAFDGILADLGVSFHHFDESSRGFSFRTDAPLDMRMNQAGGRTAADIVNSAGEQELMTMMRTYTDLKHPAAIVKAIVKARQEKPIETTFQLAESVSKTLNPRHEKKDLAQVFQALRIETNDEMESLRRFLESTVKLLRPGGRLAVLTYHSIEDRLVKNFMKCGNPEGKENKDFFGRISTPWKVITRTPITASEEEVEANPRSRSAKLRIAELLPPDKR